MKENMPNNNLAGNLIELRKQKGYSQEKLAREAEVSFSTVAHIEADILTNPTLKTIRKLAHALEVPVQKLLN